MYQITKFCLCMDVHYMFIKICQTWMIGNFYRILHWNSPCTNSSGLSVRGGTRYFYPLKMASHTSYFQRVLQKIFTKNVQILRKSSEVLVHLIEFESPDSKCLIPQLLSFWPIVLIKISLINRKCNKGNMEVWKSLKKSVTQNSYQYLIVFVHLTGSHRVSYSYIQFFQWEGDLLIRFKLL